MLGEVEHHEHVTLIDVELSYDNVEALYHAMLHMRDTNTSKYTFSLTKWQPNDKITTRVTVNANRDDWKV